MLASLGELNAVNSEVISGCALCTGGHLTDEPAIIASLHLVSIGALWLRWASVVIGISCQWHAT